MPRTSVHFPETVLDQLNELASKTGPSRNRLIVEACRRTLEERKEWPARFFEPDRLSEAEVGELRADLAEFDAAVSAARRSHGTAPF